MKEVSALIRLLEDPDEGIYGQVENELLRQGPGIVPSLHEAWQQADDPLQQGRLAGIIRCIHRTEVAEELRHWARNGSNDLLEGYLLVSRYGFPEADLQPAAQLAERISRDAWLEMNDRLTALEKIRILNYIFFEVHGFRPTEDRSPAGFFPHAAASARTGNPVSLSVLYTSVAQRLGLPVHGINLPGHFILAWLDSAAKGKGRKAAAAKVLFYINAFHRGSVFTRKEIAGYLSRNGMPPRESYFSPCSNVQVVRLAVNSISAAYINAGDEEAAMSYLRLSDAFGCA